MSGRNKPQIAGSRLTSPGIHAGPGGAASSGKSKERRGLRATIRGLSGLFLSFLALAAFSLSPAPRIIDDNLEALRMQILQRAPTDNLTLVTIDAQSLNNAGDWPWPRERFAAALQNLNAAGAGMIAFDVDFSARSTPEGDAALKEAIDANPGWIILPTFLQRDHQHKNTPFGELGEHALLASVNFELSADGRARKYRHGYFINGAYYPSLGGLLAGSEPGDVRQFGIDYGIRTDGFTVISFDDVLNNRFDPAQIADRNIVIGATAVELGDFASTPNAAVMPGVFIHALGYESLIQNRALVSPPFYWIALAGLVLLASGNWLASRMRILSLFGLQLAIIVTVLAGSVLVQAIWPVSIATSPGLFASVWTMGLAIRREHLRKEKELQDQKSAYLEYMARHDPETDLPNRRALLDDVAAHHEAPGSPGAILIVFGIERFREIRGAFGFANANSLLMSVCDFLVSSGYAGRIYRLDRSVLATWLPADGAAGTAPLQEAPTVPVRVAGQTVNVSLRIGVADTMTDSPGPETTLENAVLALDRAKRDRRSLVHWHEARSEDPQLKLAMLNDILIGLERNEFMVQYQPKYAVRQGRFSGAEALIRWKHEKFGFIPPDAFIRVAEETGAIDTLTLWITRQVIQDQVLLREKGIDLQIAVNVSARSICDPGLCQQMIELIVNAGASITVEITETAVLDRPELAIQNIRRFREAGIRISIDDYGSGQSSIAYLKTLHAHELKLDRTLITSVAESQRDRLILKSTFDLAHALDMEVVCEGVEDKASFSALAALGCDKIQGYYVARAMLLPDLTAWIDERRTGAAEMPAATRTSALS